MALGRGPTGIGSSPRWAGIGEAMSDQDTDRGPFGNESRAALEAHTRGLETELSYAEFGGHEEQAKAVKTELARARRALAAMPAPEPEVPLAPPFESTTATATPPAEQAVAPRPRRR